MSFTRWAISLALVAGSMSAGTIFTASGTLGGDPVDVSAEFVFGNGTITITLNNLQPNPTSVIQAISDLLFTVSTGQNSGTLISSSAIPRTIDGSGNYSDAAAIATGWILTTQGSSLYLDVLAGGAAGPAHLVIGPPDGSNKYSNANGSIAGNGPHNPFLAESATFVLSVPGVTALSTISNVRFSFGTTPGVELVGSDGGGGSGDEVPEPATLLLLGGGLIAVVAAYRRK